MKKPQIKINFLYYGTPFNLKKNIFFKILQKKYEVVISNNPDYVFFSVYKNNNKFLLKDGTARILKTSEKKEEKFLKKIVRKLREKDFVKGVIWFLREKKIIKPYAKILDVKGDFVKIFYTNESIKPDMSKCDWAFSFCPESELNHPKHMRIPPYIFNSDVFYLKKRRLSMTEIKKEKTKFCNFVYSNYVPPRNKFFKELSRYKHVDSPGRCMNNMPPIGSYKNADKSRISPNFVEEKLKFIKPYKFTIAFENTIRNGFNTDRMVHSFLSNSIPIFWGDKTINRDFNPKCFINCNNFRNFNEVIKKVMELDKNDELYKKMLNQQWYNNKNPCKSVINRLEKRLEEIFREPQIK
jgi:hypothetical protein